jgi:hypothetical protein
MKKMITQVKRTLVRVRGLLAGLLQPQLALQPALLRAPRTPHNHQ